jgi:DNA invertase Pin-like site-specific DNA recombinase
MNEIYNKAKLKLGDEKPRQVSQNDYSDPVFQEAIASLWSEGYTAEQIGRALGIKRHSVGAWLSRNGYKKYRAKGKINEKT